MPPPPPTSSRTMAYRHRWNRAAGYAPVQRSFRAAARRLGPATQRPPDEPRPKDAIRDDQRGGAGRGGAAQHAPGDGADAGDRSEHRGGLVVDGFLVEVDNAAG